MKTRRLATFIGIMCLVLISGLMQPLAINAMDGQRRGMGRAFGAQPGEIPPPPPGVMPVVFIRGKPHDMGFQYGRQLAAYIVRVKQALWAQLLQKADKASLLQHLLKYDAVIRKEAPEMIPIMEGMAAGSGVSYEDILMINSYVDVAWARPVQACSGFAAWGKATKDGKTIAAINFDFFPNPFSYRAIIIAYPDQGNSFISTGYAGVLGNNFTLNEKGLVELNNHGEYVRPEDKGYGLPAMLIPGHIAMTYGTWEEARDFMLNATISMGVVRHFEDIEGAGCVVESTAAKATVRYAGDFGENDYLIDTNHWLIEAMKDTKWPIPRPGSSEYRYMTVEKSVRDQHGSLDVEAFMKILGDSKRYWDGKAWQCPEGWTGNTVNCVSPVTGTHATQIAVPAERTVYVRTGDATSLWGTLAPGHTAEFVKLVLEDSPAGVTATAGKTAQQDLWHAAQTLVDSTNLNLIRMLDRAKIQYWQGLAYQADGANETADQALMSYSQAASCFCKAQAHARQVRRLAGKD
jgi:hypothetical protein